MSRPLFTIFCLVAAAAPARAAPLAEGWASVRALGMGNAYVAVVRDNDAIFYNPAGIAAVSGFNWTIADPRVGANGVTAYQTYQDYVNSGSNDPTSVIENMYGKPVWAGGGAKTALSIPGFGLAAFANADAHLQASNPAYPTVDMNYAVDYGFAGAFGVEFIPTILRLGVGAKRINRTGANLTETASTLAQLDLSSIQDQIKNRGTGYGLDLGAQLTIPSPIVKPTLALAWRDVGYTAFTHDEGPSAPPRIDPNLVFGAAFEFALPGISITPAADVRYLDRPDIQLGKKIGLGVELHLLFLNLRMGLNQGYWTAGAGADFGLVKFDVASWAAELGAYPGQQAERRYMAQLSMEIDFDPLKFFGGGSSSSSSSSGSGGASGNGGARPRLKQRR